MARETLKDFLNKKGSTSDSISYVKKEGKDGLGIDPGTNSELIDLTNEVSGLLGDYLSYLTDEAGNDYKIKPGNSEATTSKRGDKIDIADNQGADRVFVEQGTILKYKLDENSNSRKFDISGTPIETIIDKTNTNYNNHEKLKEIKGRRLDKYGRTNVDPEGEENDIVQATNKMILNNNRFANVGSTKNTSFTIRPQSPEDLEEKDKENNTGTVAVQNKFGTYDKNENIVTTEDLKKIGKSLLLKSSGFKEDVSLGSSLATAGTGFNKVGVSDIRSKNSEGFPTWEAVTGEEISVRAGRGDIVEIDPESNNASSFGSVYNTEMHFLGKNLNLLNIEALASMNALKKIAQDFFVNFMDLLRIQDRSALERSTEKVLAKNESIDIGSYMLGRSRHMTSTKLDYHIFSNLLTNTKYSYSDAVDRGIDVIFGENKNLIARTRVRQNKSKNIIQSSGFWLSVSRSILKSYDQIVQKHAAMADSITDANQLFLIYRDLLGSNKFIHFYNVMASIGDISLAATEGHTDVNIQDPGMPGQYANHRNIDALGDDKAFTPGKSRKTSGRYKTELSWNQDATPSAYILPANVIRAALRLNNAVDGTNPARGMLGSNLVKSTYFGIDVDGSGNRIPDAVVKTLEDRLDAEYVPFYIQDLRTNEIISFNAFLDSLTDNIKPTFNSVDGYGRMDSVQLYKGTTRSVGLSFTMLATNREDFDNMWYKINKLTTLMYPQWTPGSLVSTDGSSKFYQPFSQVIGASPIVRLRVGDVIKSNYSQFSLARTFGIGDAGVNAQPTEPASAVGALGSLPGIGDTDKTLGQQAVEAQDVALKIWLAAFGSPVSIVNGVANSIGTPSSNIGKIVKSLGIDIVMKGVSGLLINGFANPLAVNQIINQLKDPDVNDEKSGYDIDRKFGDGIREGLELKLMILKPNTNVGYYSPDFKKNFYLPRRLDVRVIDSGRGFEGTGTDKLCYKVQVVDLNAPSEIFKKHLHVIHTDLLPDPGPIFSASAMGLALYSTDPIGSLGDAFVNKAKDNIVNAGLPIETLDVLKLLYASNSSVFMNSAINPFTKAYESTRGRGLAGVLGGLQFNWIENFPWETDFNARAPMGCKISLDLTVIHDIPPGLDHTGYNRAPIYNVGQIMKHIAGDPYDDNGKNAEYNFKKLQSGYGNWEKLVNTIKGK